MCSPPGERGLIRGLLSPSPDQLLAQRVEALTVSRDASVDGAAAELRRIERDLHDGAQQRLVALAMDLGLAKERLAPATIRRAPTNWSAGPTRRRSRRSSSSASWYAASTRRC